MSRFSRRIERLLTALETERDDRRVPVRHQAWADLRRLFREHCRPLWGRLAGTYAIIGISSVLPYGLTLAWRYLTDTVLSPPDGTPPEARLTGIAIFCIVNSGLWVFGNACQWCFNWLSIDVGRRLVMDIKRRLHEKLQALHVGFYERNPTGRIVSRVMDDVEVLRGLIVGQLVTFCGGTTKLALGLGLVFFLNAPLALILLPTLPVYGWVFGVFRPRLARNQAAMRQFNSRLYGRATERIAGIRVVMAFARENAERRAFLRLVHDFFRLRIRQMDLKQGLALAAGAASAAVTAGILYLGVLQVKAGRMTLGDVLAFSSAAGILLQQMNAMVSLFAENQDLLVVLRRFFSLLDEPEEVVPGTIQLEGMTGKIAFDRVTFAFPGQAAPALKDVSFQIRPGEKVAFMGPSGAGKSSIFQLVLRFYDPQEGEVRVGGVNLCDAQPASVRRHVCLIQQESTIFSATLADNILYGRLDATPAQLERAARLAELQPFIATLPAGYETPVGEKGVTLSGGQKQRLALATALLTDPEVLLIDDTTSALDAATEAHIRKTLRTVLKDRTSLIITQRIATARDCDRILVMEEGRVAAEGTHDQLMARDGFYRRIALQQGWPPPAP